MKNAIAISMILLTFLSTFAILAPAVKAEPDGVWVPKANMPTARYDMAAVSLGEKLYVVGGADDTSGSPTWLSTLEVYDPATDSWSSKTPMPTPKHDIGAAVIGDKIYVVGSDSKTYSYDPATDSWSEKADIPIAGSYSDIGVGVVDGKMYVADRSEGLYCYDPSTDTWISKTPVPVERSIESFAVLDGKLYAIGGGEPKPPPSEVTRIDVYDPATDTWTIGAIPDMPTRTTHLGPTCPVLNGKIYKIGGWNGYHALSTVEVYDSATGTWSTETSMPTARWEPAYDVVNGKIYAVGGNWGGAGHHPQSANEEFRPAVEDRPVAILSASPTTVNIDDDVTFDASASYDPDGTVEYYRFDYGDGLDSGWILSSTSIHTYTESGAYYAKAKVKDDDGVESEWSEPTEITADYIELAELYFPYLIFNEDEKYFPTDFYYDDENIDNNPSNYEETWPETAYVHTVYNYEEEWLTIEYWFYYVRDAKAWDIELPTPFPECWLAHDHDWESIYVFLAKQGTDYIPSRVTYFKHSYLKGINIEDFYSTASWDSWWVEKEDDTHPVIHVASGSHASYQRAVPTIEIGLPIYYLPGGDQGTPIPELVDGGLTLDHSDFHVKYVPTPDQTWPEEKFGDCIDAPWNRDRWDGPWYTMGPPTPVIKNSLSIFAESPVNLLIINPEGQEIGWDPETETVVNEIIGAVYSGPGPEPQAVFIPENCSSLNGLDGNYAVLLAGISEGPYHLTIELATPEGMVSQTHIGEVVEGAVYVYTVSITDEVVTACPDPIAELEHLKEFIIGLPDSSFDKPHLASQRKNALFNKIDEVILKVEAGNYIDAINKLFHDLRAKIDDDSTAKDWIVDPETRSSLCVITDHIISSIEAFQQE